MEINTLFLSGGGVHCLSFLGSLKVLIEKNIIEENLTNIKNIIGVSGGVLHIIPLILGYNIDSTIKIFMNYDYTNLVDYNDLNINQLLTEFGLYKNDFIDKIIIILLKNKQLPTNITLKQLYDKIPINLVIKTTNISTSQICYLNHKNTPDIPLITAIKMTTCFPLFFEPIKYNDHLYVDGGLCGNFPLEYKRKIKNCKYIGFKIVSTQAKYDFKDIFSYLSSLYNIAWSPYDHTKKENIIEIQCSGTGMDFNITDEIKNDLIKKGKESINNLTIFNKS